MKKLLLSLFALSCTLGASAALDTEYTFDLTDPEGLGLVEIAPTANNGVDIPVGTTLTSGPVTITVLEGQCRVFNCDFGANYKGLALRFYGNAGTSRFKVSTSTAVLKDITFMCSSNINNTMSYDNGSSFEKTGWQASGTDWYWEGTWYGDDQEVTFTCNGLMTMHFITVNIGTASSLPKPELSQKEATFYEGMNNNLVTAKTEEGATLYYMTPTGDDYIEMPAEGLRITESGQYLFKARKDNLESIDVVGTYKYVVPKRVDNPADVYNLNHKDTVIIYNDWTVIGNDPVRQYLFMGNNKPGEVIPVHYNEVTDYQRGDVLGGPRVALFTKTGGTFYNNHLTLLAGEWQENDYQDVPAEVVSVEKAATDTTMRFMYVKLKAVTLEVRQSNNSYFTIWDPTDKSIQAYDAWSAIKNVWEEENTYDVEGLMIPYRETDWQIWPTWLTEVEPADAEETKIDRTHWSICAFANPEEAIEGDADGRIQAAIDGNNSTFFHSDWSTDAKEGDGEPQAFLIDMHDTKTITKIDFLPRQDVHKGRPIAFRLYIFGEDEAPFENFDDFTVDNKEDLLSNTTLGTATLSTDWDWEEAEGKRQYAYLKQPTQGRYILFIADELSEDSDGKHYFCCAEFNAYEPLNASSIQTISKATNQKDPKIYNLAGQRLTKKTKGIHIQDGKIVVE